MTVITTVELPDGAKITQTETPEAHFTISNQTFNAIVNDIEGVAVAFGTGVNALIQGFASGVENFASGAASIAKDVGGFMWHALANAVDGSDARGSWPSSAPVALDPKALALLKEWNH